MNKRNILLVDDDKDLQQLLTARLQSHNYEVACASNGKEALSMAKEKPELILLDVMLPDINGFEVCRILRKDKKLGRIPIILLTCKSSSEDKIQGLYTGADDYITKPFDDEELFARIEAVLRRAMPSEALTSEKEKSEAIEEIKRLIKEDLIVSVFQPIYYLKPSRLLGLEVLSRPPQKSYFDSPEMMFDTAFRLGMLFELEMSAHKKALKEINQLDNRAFVFFNISPYIIQEKRFKNYIRFYRQYISPNLVVFELSERIAVQNWKAFSKTIGGLKQEGFKISIDDIGSGYATLDSVVEIKPDFLKLDTHLIRGIHLDAVKQNLLKAIALFCRQSGIICVAEGIQVKQELDVLTDFGVEAGQGFFLGRPTSEIKEIK